MASIGRTRLEGHTCLKWGTHVRISVVVTPSEFKSEDPGFDPLMGQGDGQVLFLFLSPPPLPSESTLVQTCLCQSPSFVCTRHPPKMCALVKDHGSICRKTKRGGLVAAGGMEAKNTAHRNKQNILGPLLRQRWGNRMRHGMDQRICTFPIATMPS